MSDDGRVNEERAPQPIRFHRYEPPLVDPAPRPELKKGDRLRITTSDGTAEYEITDVQKEDPYYSGPVRVSIDPR